MTRSHSHKEKSRSRYPMSQDDLLEGTSARTRPLSYDDIMIRRVNKKKATKQVPSSSEVADISLGHGNTDKTSDIPAHHRKINEDSESKDVRHTSNDSRKVISRRKGDINAPKRNDKLVSDKDEVSRYHGVKLKSIWDKTEGSKRGREGESERQNLIDKKRFVLPLDVGFDNESNKRQFRDSSYRKDRTSERGSVKSKIERKQIFDDEKQVHKNSKTEWRMSSDSEKEYTRRNERMTNREGEKSEKEVRHMAHNEKDKTKNGVTDKKDYSERKGQELTRFSLHDSKGKRRRSRSREHEKDRGRSSRSRSPKANKHNDKREHEDKSSYSTKDRLGREHSEADKNRLLINGSSIHYRRSTGPSSGLGGYSPRKRKTDAAAKTPSPTLRSPERRNVQWDLQHVEKESIMASSGHNNLLVPNQKLALNINEFATFTPVVPTMEKPIVISRQVISSQMHAIESVQLTQATRPLRRLYVENLPLSASEKDLIECINKSLLSYSASYIKRSQPCISCIIHKEKNQALLEFLTPEDASSALTLDGMSFAGSNLKFRRPKDFASVTTGLYDKSVADVDSVRDIVEDSPHKIFIGGISKLISSNMFLEIAKAFGPLKAFHFEFVSDINEPRAFLEYVDHSITSKACAGLNGMKLGGRVVTAVLATPEAVLKNVGKLPFYEVPEHAKPLLEEPTSVLKLMNVLDHEGLLSLSESELEDILEDVKLECSRFGTVKSVNVARPTSSVRIIEACGVKNTTEVVGELSKSEPTETRENISPSLEVNGSDNCVEMCEPPPSDEDMFIKESENPGGFTEDLVNEQNAPVTESESISKASIEGDLQFEEHHAKIGKKLEEINVGCDEKNILINLEDADMENKSLVMESCGEILKSEDNILTKNDVITTSVEVEDGGCVFVEYRRVEAACVAAHCLHGRIFDDRVVTVGYVGHDHYRAMFHR